MRLRGPGTPNCYRKLSGPGIGTAGSGVINSLGLIQTLRSQEATAEAQLEQDSIKFGPAYPKLREDRAALARVQQALRDEVRRIAARAENDCQIAQQSEKGARSVYAERRRAADKLNDKTIEYVILQNGSERKSSTLSEPAHQIKRGWRSRRLAIL